MVSYSNFNLTTEQINSIKTDNARRAIERYIKQNGHEPTNISQFYTATPEEIERRRRSVYSYYLTKGIEPINNGGGNQNTNTGTTNNETNDEETTTVSGNFTISPQFHTNFVYTNHMSNIIHGFPREVDYSKANLTFTGDNGVILTISDLTKVYDIPTGIYDISGYVGRNYNSYYGDYNNAKCAHQYGLWRINEHGLAIDNNSQISLSLHLYLDDTLIISDQPFTYSYNIRFSNPIFDSYFDDFSQYYYLYVTNGCRYMGASYVDYMEAGSKKLSSGSMVINITEGFQQGARLVYNFD